MGADPQHIQTPSGLHVVSYTDNRGKKLVREKDPISLLLTKLAYWLAQQEEYKQIQQLPRPVRKRAEKEVIKHVFRNLKDHHA